MNNGIGVHQITDFRLVICWRTRGGSSPGKERGNPFEKTDGPIIGTFGGQDLKKYIKSLLETPGLRRRKKKRKGLE